MLATIPPAYRQQVAYIPEKAQMTERLTKTSVQLSAETLKWLDTWPGVTRSEATRLALERAEFLSGNMEKVSDLALKYWPILVPALEDFTCKDYRTVARALPGIVGAFIQESQDNDRDSWADEFQRDLNPADLHAELKKMHPVDRIYLLDCIVARRYWGESKEEARAISPMQDSPGESSENYGSDKLPKP
jgi:hypothetical protein